MKLFEKIKVVELELIEEVPNEQLACTFIIEIFKEVGKDSEFFPRVYRREFFRIQPTFPQDSEGKPHDEPSDEEVLVVDVGNWEQIKGNNVNYVIDAVVNKIRSDYGLNKAGDGKQ